MRPPERRYSKGSNRRGSVQIHEDGSWTDLATGQTGQDRTRGWTDPDTGRYYPATRGSMSSKRRMKLQNKKELRKEAIQRSLKRRSQ